MLGNHCDSSSSPERSDTAQAGSLQRWAREKRNLPEQRIKIQDCSQTLQFVAAAAASLSPTKRFLRSPACPWAGSTRELPTTPCAGWDFALIADTLTCALATALPGPFLETFPAWCEVGRTVRTQLALCQPGTPWHEQSNPALPHGRELASNLQFLLLH